jgi:hypothetical protein
MPHTIGKGQVDLDTEDGKATTETERLSTSSASQLDGRSRARGLRGIDIDD